MYNYFHIVTIYIMYDMTTCTTNVRTVPLSSIKRQKSKPKIITDAGNCVCLFVWLCVVWVRTCVSVCVCITFHTIMVVSSFLSSFLFWYICYCFEILSILTLQTAIVVLNALSRQPAAKRVFFLIYIMFSNSIVQWVVCIYLHSDKTIIKYESNLN